MGEDMAQRGQQAKAMLVRGQRSLVRSAVSTLWPSRSLLSHARGAGGGVLPVEDWKRLDFISAPICDQCGIPVEIDIGEAQTCAGCLAKPPPWSQARSALVYDDVSRRIVLDLKRRGRRDGLELIASWMTSAGRDILNNADLLIPVPLHYRRLVTRGYNQAGWIAQAVGRKSGVPVKVAALKRIKATPSQGMLSAKARRRNVAGAFQVRDRYREAIEGKSIVVIDDVFTTGATVSGCVRTLRKAGAADISVLVLARVVRERDITI